MLTGALDAGTNCKMTHMYRVCLLQAGRASGTSAGRSPPSSTPGPRYVYGQLLTATPAMCAMSVCMYASAVHTKPNPQISHTQKGQDEGLPAHQAAQGRERGVRHRRPPGPGRQGMKRKREGNDGVGVCKRWFIRIWTLTYHHTYTYDINSSGTRTCC